MLLPGKGLAPQKGQEASGGGQQGMGDGRRGEEGGIGLIFHGEGAGVEVVGLQPAGDGAEGVEFVRIEVKAQGAEDLHGKLGAGERVPDPDLDVQRGGQSRQVVVQVPLGVVAHTLQQGIQRLPLALGQGQTVQPDIGGDAVVVVAAGLFGDKAPVEGGAVIPRRAKA